MQVKRERLDLAGEGRVPPPALDGPLYACASIVVVVAYVPHATLDVEVRSSAGALLTPVVGVPGGWPNPHGCVVPVPALVAEQQVRARQHHDGRTSDWSEPVFVRNHRDDFPSGLPRPEVNPEPLHDCGSRTGVANLLTGSRVWITDSGTQVGNAEPAIEHHGVNVDPFYGHNAPVRVYAMLCGDPSPASVLHVAQPGASPLSAPGFELPYESGTQLVVTGMAPGARFTLHRNGSPVVVDGRTWGVRHFVGIDPPFAVKESFLATQRLCDHDPPSPPGSVSVAPCSELPAPVPGPLQDGDSTIVLMEFVPDAHIRVWRNSRLVGEGSGPVVSLNEPVFDGDTVHIAQDLPGGCQSQFVWEMSPKCVDPPYGSDPAGPDLFPVGWFDYDGGTFPTGTPTDGDAVLDIKARVYYPAEDDGANQPFNLALRITVEAPVVVMAHGNHNRATPSYLGYEYLQRRLARMGIVSASIDANGTNGVSGTDANIVKRVQLFEAHLRHWVAMKTSGEGPLAGAFDLRRFGVLGHSRGGEAAVLLTDSSDIPAEVDLQAVLALAPTASGVTVSLNPTRDVCVVLPAADGDVTTLAGVRYYDRAQPKEFRSQVLVEGANHNYFNSQWLNDDYVSVDASGGSNRRTRDEQERILASVACAFFRATLDGHRGSRDYLAGRIRADPSLDLRLQRAFQLARADVIDDHEDGNPHANVRGGANTNVGASAKEHSFAAGGSPYTSLRGATRGLVLEPASGFMRFELGDVIELAGQEVWVRATRVSDDMASFLLGVEDSKGVEAWVPGDGVGALPRRWPHLLRTNVLSSYRFPAACFQRAGRELSISRIVAVLLRNAGRTPVAFDDLHLVRP
jgi:hypothetical protein